ncbi:MAG: hypothetical protein AAF823_11370 [Planctomycetota bacterium]
MNLKTSSLLSAILAATAVPCFAAVTLPFSEDFDAATVTNDVAGTTANTTDFTYTTQAAQGGWTVDGTTGGELQLRVNGGRDASLGGGSTYVGSAAVTVDDPIDIGFTMTTDLVFPTDGLFSSSAGDVYLAVGATDLNRNFFIGNEGLDTAGYAIGITQDSFGNFGDAEATLRLLVNGVEVDTLLINAPGTEVGDSAIGDFIGASLQLTLAGTPDGLGGLDLVGTLADLDAGTSIQVSANVAAADLATGDQAGLRIAVTSNNDYGFNADNIELTLIPEPGAAALTILGGMAALTARRNK